MKKETVLLLGQIIGILPLIFSFISYQMRTNQQLLLVQTLAVISMMTSYLLIGATAGGLLNGICLIRNIIYYKRDIQLFSKKFVPYVLAGIIVLVGALSWQGPVTLLILIALAINTVAMSWGDNQKLRWSILLTSSMVLVYDLIVTSWGGAANEVLCLTSSAIGLYRFRKTK